MTFLNSGGGGWEIPPVFPVFSNRSKGSLLRLRFPPVSDSWFHLDLSRHLNFRGHACRLPLCGLAQLLHKELHAGHALPLSLD